jgi:hypothetical protein
MNRGNARIEFFGVTPGVAAKAPFPAEPKL